MRKSSNFSFLFFFEFPFFLIWKTIKYSLYYSIIIIFFISIFIYLILPIRHDIFAIYKMFFLIKELIKILCTINHKIIVKRNRDNLSNRENYIDDIIIILGHNKKNIIYTKLE